MTSQEALSLTASPAPQRGHTKAYASNAYMNSWWTDYMQTAAAFGLEVTRVTPGFSVLTGSLTVGR